MTETMMELDKEQNVEYGKLVKWKRKNGDGVMPRHEQSKVLRIGFVSSRCCMPMTKCDQTEPGINNDKRWHLQCENLSNFNDRMAIA
jgi:hypothetical protein